MLRRRRRRAPGQHLSGATALGGHRFGALLVERAQPFREPARRDDAVGTVVAQRRPPRPLRGVTGRSGVDGGSGTGCGAGSGMGRGVGGCG